MNRTKREENAMIIYFIFYIILFSVLIFYIITFFYPKIVNIEDKKKETKQLYDSIIELEKKGISFSEFIELNKKVESNPYEKEILKDIDEVFYNKHLVNNKSGNYENFLTTKANYLDSDENKKIQNNRDKNLIEILPYYSENYIGKGENKPLTNFMFVTYVESLLETFNLENSNGIGIKEVKILDDYISKTGESNSIEANIYSIPLNLSIKGKKKGVIDFLHYIENVGKISVKNNALEVLDDGEFKEEGFKKTLAGEKASLTYNIYKHQIIDISSIKMGSYIDSYGTIGENKYNSFIDYIKNQQGNEEIEITIDLLFYVRGYPQYKLEEYIEEVLNKHKSLLIKVNTELKNKNNNDYKISKLEKINKYLKDAQKDINNIKKEIQDPKKIEEIMKKSVDYKNKFDNFENIIK